MIKFITKIPQITYIIFANINGFNARFIHNREFRESALTNWASLGLIVLIMAFFCAKNNSQIRWVYYLFFLLPIAGIILTQPWRWDYYGGSFTKIALLYGGFFACSTFWSDSPDVYKRFIEFICFSTWFCGSAWLAHKKKIDTRLIINVLIYTGAAMALFLIIIYYAENSLITRMWPQGWKRFGPSNPIDIGMYYSLTTLLCFIKLIDICETQNKTKVFLLMTMNLLPVIASQSRGPILSFLMTLVFIILFYKFNKKYICFLLLFIILSLTFIIFSLSIYNTVLNRLSENSFRKEIWIQSISRTIEHNPLLGCGRGIKINIPVETKSLEGSSILNFQGSHNQFVDAFYSLGTIGLILFLAVFINIFLHYTKAPDLFPFFIWLILGTLCGLTVSSSNIDIRSNWMYFWIPTGLIGAILSQKSFSRKLKPISIVDIPPQHYNSPQNES